MDFIIEDGLLTAYHGNAVSVTIPEEVKILERNVFAHCDFLQEVTLPKNLIVIRDMAFYFCKNLTKIVFPQTLTYIGMRAFEGCERLEEIWLPNVNCGYGYTPFHGCPCTFHFIGGYKELDHLIDRFSWSNLYPPNGSVMHHPENLEKTLAFPSFPHPFKSNLMMELYLLDWEEWLATSIEKYFSGMFKCYMKTAPLEKLEKFFCFLNADNIDGIILYANKLQRYELQILLMNYKYEVLGFSENPFKL